MKDARKRFAAVQTLMEADGIAENLAKAAVQEKGYHDMAECRIWLLENEFEDKLIEELSAQFNENHGKQLFMLIMTGILNF